MYLPSYSGLGHEAIGFLILSLSLGSRCSMDFIPKKLFQIYCWIKKKKPVTQEAGYISFNSNRKLKAHWVFQSLEMFILGNEGRWPWRENTRIQRNPTLEGSVLRGTGDASQQLEEQSSRCSVSRGATLGSPSLQSHRQKRTTPIQDKHRALALEERADDSFSLDELESKNLLASLIHLSSVLHWREWELELHQYFQSPFMFCFLGSEVIHLATVDLPDFLQIWVRFKRKKTRATCYLAPQTCSRSEKVC